MTGTTDNVGVPNPGGGKAVATFSITEDSITKELQRIVLTKSDGSEIIFNGNGAQTPGNSAPVVPADQYSQYETVAASQTDQAMGATGGSGDYLAGVLIIPGTTGAGSVSIKDGSGSSITIFTGGGTLADLKPFMVPLGLFSTSGAWKLTTGADVTAIGIGKFT